MSRIKMIRIIYALVAVVGVYFAMWLAWNTAYPSGTWRYKMTVEVETPEGVKTGYAVREVSVQLVPHFLPEVSSTKTLKGEAVVVDLGERGQVFALLSGYSLGSDYALMLLFNAFSSGTGDEKKQLSYYENLKIPPTALEPQWYPKFVRFRDPNDPKTVESLLDMKVCDGHKGWPEKLCVKEDRFEQAFGQGVKLKSVTVEMTDEPVTWGRVNEILPWLMTLRGGYLDGQFLGGGPELSNILHGGNFQTGAKK